MMLNERFRMLELQSEEHAKLASTQLTELQVGAAEREAAAAPTHWRSYACARAIHTLVIRTAWHGVEAILLEARFD
jgi:hypothetical protein